MEHKIKAIVFDLDGTLLYSLEDIQHALNISLKKRGFATQSLDQVRASVGHGLMHSTRCAMPENSSEDLVREVHRDIVELYAKDPVGLSRTYDGVQAMLEELADSKVKLALWSNKDHALVQVIVERLFPGIFEAVMGKMPDLAAKPEPDAGLQLCGSWSLKPDEVAYVGDSEVDAATAANCGFTFVAVEWGYRTRRQLMDAGAQLIASQPADIPALLRLRKSGDR